MDVVLDVLVTVVVVIVVVVVVGVLVVVEVIVVVVVVVVVVVLVVALGRVGVVIAVVVGGSVVVAATDIVPVFAVDVGGSNVLVAKVVLNTLSVGVMNLVPGYAADGEAVAVAKTLFNAQDRGTHVSAWTPACFGTKTHCDSPVFAHPLRLSWYFAHSVYDGLKIASHWPFVCRGAEALRWDPAQKLVADLVLLAQVV